MIIAGIDESGKGPVIGPMCIAIVILEEGGEKELERTGIKDSKLLSPKKRKHLTRIIKETALEEKYLMIPADEIDKMRTEGINMNKIVVNSMGELIKKTKKKADLYIADAADVNPRRFQKRLTPYLPSKAKLLCEHKADTKYIPVAAASIIAKVERDNQIEKLREKHGEIGSGYPNDPLTINFLKKTIEKEGKYPLFVRKTWKTAQRIKKETQQTKIKKFSKK
ncbi:MAG: ribonuclease HII [Candidatus Wukongarchaeota archaeon]|nr:ribonuclease HII [Candidatus Wukongarchaeota archaeon]